MAYATVEQLLLRWPGLPAESHQRAQTLLEDAAVHLDAEKVPVVGDGGDVTDLPARRMISCAMVERAMKADGSRAGVTQGSQTFGPFAESVTYANPTGDLYLTKAERKLLGVGKQQAFTISMAPEAPADPLWWLS
ncbi:Gp19/Gp15/Gp42 family protein [Oerskovia sp. NPDC060338]|uniref:Gp19/Gp15/Gp42 family protein n=1 Tax=Oerskovia sp. NPDC060338 TaxID=3347100 RepID=UPI003663300A